MLSPVLVLSLLIGYFLLLIAISYVTGKNANNQSFFNANKSAPWYLVAFGMIGSSISGVTFVSIPGSVATNGFSYMAMVFGYLLGYLVIGAVLMPMYYRMNLTSIYTYLEERFGYWAYKTGAFFFLLSRTIGSAFRLYLVASVLQIAIFDSWNVPFAFTVIFTIVLIWLYTFRGGIKTIIWTDTLQTFFMLLSGIITIYIVSDALGTGFYESVKQVFESSYSQIVFSDYLDNKFFVKQFIAGAFIAIVMTGLDQDMMQKNLSCKNIKDAQKNMFWFSLSLIVVNLIFLTIGALLYMYVAQFGIEIPARKDDLFPLLAVKHFPLIAGLCFLLGIIAAAYSSADSALTALTTSFCVDFLDFNKKNNEQWKTKTRYIVHIAFSVITILVIIVFKLLNDDSVINSVFTAAGYTYGPLLGLFSFGILTSRKVRFTYLIPLICIASPIITWIISLNSVAWFGGYKFGFELLVMNGLITFVGLFSISKK
jgi:SSS family transporter